MNVDVLNRSAIQPATASRLAIADCDITRGDQDVTQHSISGPAKFAP